MMNRRQFFARMAGAAVATQVPLPAPVPDINRSTFCWSQSVGRNMAVAPGQVLTLESIARGMAKVEAQRADRVAWMITSVVPE
jgi:hypothetical protein